MILTITANVTIDRALVVPGYDRGGVFRAREVRVSIGGKGVNVARVARTLGGAARCCGFLAGHSGRFAAEVIAQEGIPARWTWLDSGETRTCVILADPDLERVTIVNEPGPTVSESDWAVFQADILAAAADCKTVCISGSLPPGAPLAGFADLLRALRALDKTVWVDISGKPLSIAAHTPGVCIKVNTDEAAVLLEQSIPNAAAATAAAHELHRRLATPVALTLGADGALLVASGGAWWAHPPRIAAVSPVGSGDSFLAGLVVALDRSDTPAAALRSAAAAGAANALTLGAGHFTDADFMRMFEQTRVEGA